MPVTSLQNDKFIDLSSLKAFADDKINVREKLKFELRSVESIVGKGEKCWSPAFSPFSTMFSKGFYLKVVKSRDCVVKS